MYVISSGGFSLSSPGKPSARARNCAIHRRQAASGDRAPPVGSRGRRERVDLGLQEAIWSWCPSESVDCRVSSSLDSGVVRCRPAGSARSPASVLRAPESSARARPPEGTVFFACAFFSFLQGPDLAGMGARQRHRSGLKPSGLRTSPAGTICHPIHTEDQERQVEGGARRKMESVMGDARTICESRIDASGIFVCARAGVAS